MRLWLAVLLTVSLLLAAYVAVSARADPCYGYCPVDCVTVIGKAARGSKQVWDVDQEATLDISVGASRGSRDFSSGSNAFVTEDTGVCYKYQVGGDAVVVSVEGSKPTLSINATYWEGGGLKHIDASATGGRLKVVIRGTGSYGYVEGWIGYTVCVHEGGGGGGGGNRPKPHVVKGELWIWARGLPEWLWGAVGYEGYAVWDSNYSVYNVVENSKMWGGVMGYYSDEGFAKPVQVGRVRVGGRYYPVYKFSLNDSKAPEMITLNPSPGGRFYSVDAGVSTDGGVATLWAEVYADRAGNATVNVGWRMKDYSRAGYVYVLSCWAYNNETLVKVSNDSANWMNCSPGLYARFFNVSGTVRVERGLHGLARVRVGYRYPVNFSFTHWRILYAPLFERHDHTVAPGSEVYSGTSRGPGTTTLWVKTGYIGRAWVNVEVNVEWNLSDPHVDYAIVTRCYSYYSGIVSVANRTGSWTSCVPGLRVQRVRVKAYLNDGPSYVTLARVELTYPVNLTPRYWVLTWNGTGAIPSRNGTVLWRRDGEGAAFTIDGRGGHYVLAAYFSQATTPILPGVFIPLPLKAGNTTLNGNFTVVIINFDGENIHIRELTLPVTINAPREYRSWYRVVTPRNCTNLPAVLLGNETEGRLLGVESPRRLGPAVLCVNNICHTYNVTRLVLRLSRVEYNLTHVIIHVNMSYECCPETPVRERIRLMTVVSGERYEGRLRGDVLAVPYSILENTASLKIYARYEPGGPVPLTPPLSVPVVVGTVKPLKWVDEKGVVVLSRPYIFPHGLGGTPEPWKGDPGRVVLVAEDTWQVIEARWNGTAFIADFGRSIKGVRIRITWIPPDTTNLVVASWRQRW